MQSESLTGEIVAGQTNVHPVGLAAMVVLAVLTLALPRRWALAPLLVLACFVPAGQRVVVLSLDFTFLRLLVLCGWLRVILRGELRRFSGHPLDACLAAWALVGLVANVLLWGTLPAFVAKLGAIFDAVGTYLLFRCLLRTWVDLDRVVWTLTLLSVPVTLAFLVEKSTGRNVFAVFGGVPFVTLVREGRLRCQGAFAHPILAGCFWASLLPLIVARWWRGPRHRALVAVGTVCALSIVVLCASSTPIGVVAAGGLGAAAFVLRRHMRLVRWGALAVLTGLHLVMEAPVWHLLARANVVGGSTGWHRYYLIDQTVTRFREWWLVGIRSTAHWGRQMDDVTNQFVLVGLRGGVLSLILFVLCLAFAFRAAGRAWRASWPDPPRVAFGWALGTAIFAHCLAFLAVSYFGQIIVVLYLALAAAASMELHARRQRALAARAAARAAAREAG